MTDIKFGALIFDNPKDPTEGWAALPGERAFRVPNPQYLSSDVIWWTNADYKSFWQHTDIWRIANLKHDKYLVVTPMHVLKEWGRDPEQHNAEFVAEISAKAFNRIMLMAWNLVREVVPKARKHEAFLGKTLRDDLRCLLPEIDYPAGETATIMQAGTAYEEFTSTTGVRKRKGTKSITLRRPRVSYTLEMLQTPVPKGPFEFVSRGEIKEANRVRWVIDNDRPLMIDVSVRRIDPNLAPIYSFGGAMSKTDKRRPRNWIAHPELIVLSRFADIDVKSAWMGREYWAMIGDLPEAVKEFLSSPYTSLSWSAGVVAETIWRITALGAENTWKKDKEMAPGDDKARISWPGAWVKAADKSSMFQAAMRLNEMGHSVNGYGLGFVNCMVAQQDMEQYIRDGLQMGLLPNALDVAPGMFHPTDTPWTEEDPKTFHYVKLLLNRKDDILWKLDQIPLLSTKEEQNHMIKMIMGQAKQSVAAKARVPA